jgi:hypothetical protein
MIPAAMMKQLWTGATNFQTSFAIHGIRSAFDDGDISF